MQQRFVGMNNKRPPLVTRAGAILLAITLAVGVYMLGYNNGSTAGTSAGASGAIDLSRFNEVLDLVEQRHVGDETEQQLIDGAIRGLVESLNDPYSQYLTSEEMEVMLGDLSGSFEGIGAVIESRSPTGDPCTTIGPDCYLLVVSPIDGSPAKAAGIISGDRVTAVDGVGVDGETLDSSVRRVRGAKGTTVVITVVRGEDAPKDISIVRDVIVVPAVEPKQLSTAAGDPVGYIRLAEFSEVASEQFRTALQTVIDAGTTRIILDLRDNPGGYLSAALSIASEFIGDGVVYTEETSNGKRTETRASGGGLATDPSIKLVVLINKGSASASEILAGALQDRGRAELVGETTFGKGVVQTFIDLSDGSGLKLTIAKWLTPNGTWVHKVGIAPDYPVAAASTQGADDLVLTKALDLLK
jgi:carboxyl-terminal processing protease